MENIFSKLISTKTKGTILTNDIKNYNYPDSTGHFEEFGGRYVPETLIHSMNSKNITSIRNQINLSKI